jgi:predicted nucleic acid-binding protein
MMSCSGNSLKVFVDTGPFVAFLNSGDVNHKSALEQFDKIDQTKRVFFTSDYVLDEILSFVTRKKPELALYADEIIQESGSISLLKVDEKTLASSKAFMRKYPHLRLSLTDWTSAVLARDYAIGKIYSYDSDFDELKTLQEFKNIRRVEKI